MSLILSPPKKVAEMLIFPPLSEICYRPLTETIIHVNECTKYSNKLNQEKLFLNIELLYLDIEIEKSLCNFNQICLK